MCTKVACPRPQCVDAVLDDSICCSICPNGKEACKISLKMDWRRIVPYVTNCICNRNPQ